MYATIAKRAQELIIHCPSFQAACGFTGTITDAILDQLRERVHFGDADSWFALGIPLPRPLAIVAEPSTTSNTAGRGAGRELSVDSNAQVFLQAEAFGGLAGAGKKKTLDFYQFCEDFHREMTGLFDDTFGSTSPYLAFRSMQETRAPMRTPLFESDDGQEYFTAGWQLITDSGGEL